MKNRLQKGDALLIVDPQIDFFPQGALAVPHSDEIVPIINEWIQAAAENDIPIFLSCDWHPANHCSFKEQGGPWPTHCVKNTTGAKIYPSIQLNDDMIFIYKATEPNVECYSAFRAKTLAGRSLADYLTASNIDQIWLLGLALDYCVYETALEARDNNFKVRVLLKGTRSITEETGDTAKTQLREAGVILEENANPYC